MTMTPQQRQVADAYASLAPQSAVVIFDNLVSFARTLSDPLTSAGATLAANHFVYMTKALKRDKEREKK